MLLRWAWLSGYVSENCGCGGKFVLLPKNLENVAGVFQILKPTAPTRIKLSPALLSLLPHI